MEKQEQKELLEIQKQQEALKATSIKQMIRNQEREAEEKRRHMMAEKRAMARQNFENKVMKENAVRMNNEKMVSKMEQEELELIQRLQNTQLMQKQAYEELENALAGGENGSPGKK